ncbi:MarR family transcriptional regulator [Bacillus sp. TH13]|uniref:MarR family winged helix-turn-helix transcriptional regulator n=1 Tax=Bacillus sp. TH13 TaxID=2796379 RepID=UPI001911623E|nr:MarR family transcriptional regulator [Bacillus sp. TH13]MBK5491747.1 MarR family transcriptional regulator [Bacillus sp. TH13]
MKLEEFLSVMIHRTDLKLNKYYQKVVTPFNLSIESWDILVILWEKDGVTQKEISQRSGKDQPNIARMLFALEKKGYIYRIPHETDRRSLRVYLTENGKKLKDELFPPSVEAYKFAFRGLSEEEERQFRKTLDKIYNNVKDM